MLTGHQLGVGHSLFWELSVSWFLPPVGNVGPLWPGLLISQKNPEFGILK